MKLELLDTQILGEEVWRSSRGKCPCAEVGETVEMARWSMYIAGYEIILLSRCRIVLQSRNCGESVSMTSSLSHAARFLLLRLSQVILSILAAIDAADQAPWRRLL